MTSTGWVCRAVPSAAFAALTAIFAKIGVRDVAVAPYLATLIRTPIVVVLQSAFVIHAGKWSNPLALSFKSRLPLVLSAFQVETEMRP